MFDVTGFSMTKFVGFAVAQAILCAVGIFVFHAVFSVGFASFFSVLIVAASLGVGAAVHSWFLKRELKKHTSILRGLTDSLSDVLVIKDYQGSFTFCNATVAKLYNSTPEQMTGKDDFFFTGNKEQSDFFLENVRSIMDRFEKEEVYETSTDAVTGEVRHFRSTKVPYRDVCDNPKILVVAKDVTDIVQLKEEADRNKNRLEQVLDVSQGGVWEWNITTNQVLHNKQWERITGIKDSENTFAEFDGCILAEDREKVHSALETLIKHNQSYSIEFRMKRPDGQIIWIWDRGRVAEYDGEGQPLWLVGNAQDITSDKDNQQKVANLAYYDQLTGLVNRAHLEGELENTIALSKAEHSFSALLFVDLDRFKLLNDSYGHHMGDKLLQAIADRLRKVDKKRGIIARFGGDEFVIILPLLDKDAAAAARKAQDYAEAMIREVSVSIALKSDVQMLEIDYSITASVGGIVFNSEETSASEILQLADTALYRVKAAGGKSAKVFGVDMQDELSHASNLQKSVYHAVANREFGIYIQPKYNFSGEIFGAEALVRWFHPEFGVLLPGTFIDIVEENDLILPIGEMVLDQACEILARWQSSSKTKHLEIAINLSAKQIWQSNFVDNFMERVNAHNIDPTKLVAEVTESVLIQDINDATDKLAKLRSYGVSVSLDDFGTGYSSLSYLKSLPIDELKIDKSFIHDITNDTQARLMIKSIIELAKNFDMKVVSEGVEDREQLELLKSLGVTCFQGFFFCEPLPEQAIDSLLQDERTAC